MKVPDLFIPEKNLEEQTESLKHPKKKETEELENTKTLSDCLMYKTWHDHKTTEIYKSWLDYD